MLLSRKYTAMALALLSFSAIAGTQTGVKIETTSFGVTHYEMTYDEKMVYEADIRASEKPPARMSVTVQVGNFKGVCSTVEEGVSGELHGASNKQGLTKGYYLACAIRGFTPDDTAQVDVVYVQRDVDQGTDISEHFSATIRAGQPFESYSKAGAKVSISLEPRRA